MYDRNIATDEWVSSTADSVVEAFIRHLEARPCLIASEHDLPHPKATIKAALKAQALLPGDAGASLLCERLVMHLAGYRPDSEIEGCRALVAKLGEIADSPQAGRTGVEARIERAFDCASPAEVESYRRAVDARSGECLVLAAEWRQAVGAGWCN